MLITRDDYFMGRDVDRRYSAEMTPQIEASALLLLPPVNELLKAAAEAGVTMDVNPLRDLRGEFSLVASGWRPNAINSKTKNAAPNSKHKTGNAVDVYDPDGDLDEWLLSTPGQLVLVRCDLYMEHPAATKGWSHLQRIPPGSRNRVFYP